VDRDDEVQIELGRSVRRQIERKKNPLKDRTRAVFPCGSPQDDQPPVFVAEDVMRAIERLAENQKDREVGGVLLGGLYQSEKGPFIEVTDLIEAREARGTEVSLTFTHETWKQISEEQSRRAPDSRIVGWYHSHPALGVFMSKEDEFIHTSFFAEPWHIALVVDPVYHKWGCFKWSDGALEQTSGLYIVGDRKSAGRMREYAAGLNQAMQFGERLPVAASGRFAAPAPRRTAVLWAVICLLAVSEAVVGYLALRKPGARTGATDYMQAAGDSLAASDLTGAVQFLRMELSARPGNREAWRQMRQLDRVLADPALRSFDNERLDRINFVLAAAERAVRQPLAIRQPSEFEGLDMGEPAGSSRFSPKVPASDPVKGALDIFRWAASTRQVRLKRAVLIRRIARDEQQTRVAAHQAYAGAWYDRAVERLSREHLREIAFGMQCRREEYEALFRRLGKRDQAAVKRIRLSLSGHR